MPYRRYIPGLIAIAAVHMGTGVVCAEDYPNKTIRIVTSEAGGNGDFHARLIAQGLNSALGQSVIVENRGGTVIAGLAVANATPDGYTLLVQGSSLWIGPLLQKAPYDVIRDFSPITATSNAPSVLVVHPSVPIKSVRDLIAYAKSRPGELNYAAAATGSPAHIAGELFKSLAGVNIAAIPYKAAGPALNDVIGGQVQLMFSSAAAVAPHMKSGRLNALAVTSAQPSTLFPDLPTVAAAGVPGYESGSRQGIWAPAKTPAALIKRLNQEIVQVLNKPDVKERFLAIGAEATPGTPEQFTAAIKSEITRTTRVIKDAGIRVE